MSNRSSKSDGISFRRSLPTHPGVRRFSDKLLANKIHQRRESFGKARSQPPRTKGNRDRSIGSSSNSGESIRSKKTNGDEKLQITTDSGTRIQVDLKRSRSLSNVNTDGENQHYHNHHWTNNLGVGATSEELEEEFVTRHMLYKEAMYTSVHFLGKASEKFPCTKEQLCLYAHEVFSTSRKEQHAVIDHMKSDPFPNVGVNANILKAEGLRCVNEIKIPNPYCVIAIETEGSYGKKDWHQFESASNPSNKNFFLGKIRSSKFVRRKDSIQPPADRRIQFYEKIPTAHRTTIVAHDPGPVWDQYFQCVSIHQSMDSLTIEVWDNVDDYPLLKSIEAYNKAQKVGGQGDRKVSRIDPKRSDIFLGKVSKRVNDISCEGFEKFIHLEGPDDARDKSHGRLRVRLWLVHLYRHGKHSVDLVDKRTMLTCLWDWVLSFEKKRKGDNWDGRLPNEATCLLYQYALQTGISEETHCHIRWNAYAKHKLDMEGLDVPLKDLEVILEKRKSTMKPNRKSKIDDAQLEIENSILILVEREIFPIIWNHLNEPEDRVTKALKSYKNCEEVLSKFEYSVTLHIIRGLFEKAIRLCVLEWYQDMFEKKMQSVQDVDRCQKIKFHTEVINETNKLLAVGLTKWHPHFLLLAQYESYMPVLYDELQKMVNLDIETICWTILSHYDNNHDLREILRKASKHEECIAMALFSLYAGTQTFVEAQNNIFSEKPDYDNLDNYYKWFRPILVLWLGFAVIRGSEMITRCINVDSTSLENIHTKTSTSALDTAAVIHQLVHFWQKLRWPNVSEKYVIINFLIEVMCYYAVLFAKRKHEKLELEGYFDTEDRFDISERLCTALNNIEYVKEALERIPEEIKYETLIQELEAECGVTTETRAYRLRLKDIFSVTFDNVEIIFSTILKGMGNRIRPEITRCVRDALEILLGLERVDNEYLNDAVDPILNYIDGNIITLSRSLLELNFARTLQLFWNLILQEMIPISDSFQFDDEDGQVIFFTRILMILPILKTYFENGDGGLNEDELNTVDYHRTHYIISAHTLRTREVISQFYGSRGVQQMNILANGNTGKSPYGFLSVRVGYWHGSLTVEVISAWDLAATDESFHFWQWCKKKPKSNDPFVEIELQPEHKFANARTSKTITHWKNLNPTFNEKFQWDVSKAESVQEDIVIVLTVKDYDYMSRNDFIGEAAIPFEVIPGVAANPVPQPMHLQLRIVEPNSILNILKGRTWDNEARRFYERQARRHSVE